MNESTDIIEGIVDGLTDKWSNDDKRKFIEDWLNDSFMFETDEFSSVNDSTEADSDKRKQRKRSANLSSELQDKSDNDSEISTNATADPDDSSEVNVSTRRKKRKTQIFVDSESQGNDSCDVCEFTTASSINENSELFTGEDSQSVSQRDSQSNNDRLNDTFKTSDKNHDLLDGENDEDSEVYVSMRKKKRACIAISDGESQESELEVSQGVETSPTNENSDDENTNDDVDDDRNDDDNVDDDDDEDVGDEDDNDDGDHSIVADGENSSSNGKCYPTERYLENEFIKYLQYMLSYCLDSDFLTGANSQNELEIAKSKIEEKLKDLLQNMLKSEAWQTTFQEAMETFPRLQQKQIERQGGCEACARIGRIASKRLTFTGSAYAHNNFESQETSLPNKMSFEVGKFCARRSELYHRVFHYKFHLRQRCVEAVNQFSDNDVTSDFVLNKCLDDEQWIKKNYRNFSSLITNVTTWFENANKWK